MSKKKGQIQYFSSGDDGTMVWIIVSAVLFHLFVAGVCYFLQFIPKKEEPKPIPVFEMVQVAKEMAQPEPEVEPAQETQSETSPEDVSKAEAEVPPEATEQPQESAVQEPIQPPPPEVVPEQPAPAPVPKPKQKSVDKVPPEPKPEKKKRKQKIKDKVNQELPPEPKPVPETEPKKKEEPKPEPEKKQEPAPEKKPEPEQKQEPKPESKPEKVAEADSAAKPAPKPAPKPKKKDWDIDDLDTPPKKVGEAPSLKPVGSVGMDAAMRAYLAAAKKKIMDRFSPHPGIEVNDKTKTTVQFVVDREGNISAIILKDSSGNKAWDQSSMHAVLATKNLPPLPESFSGESLVLQFNFTPN